MSKRKSAGRCVVCKKWVALDDIEVVKDLSIVALRPAYEEANRQHGPGCQCNVESIEEMVTDLLTKHPICSACWHSTNRKRDLAEGALRVVKAHAAVPPRAQFRWVRVA